MNHLLSIEDLDRAGIERIVEQAARFAEVSDREIKKVPALRGRMVLNLFYEASTRTRSSFELAAKRLSADVVNFAASGSSVEKGESLKDTVLTLSAHKPDAIVLRTPWAGAAELVSGWCSAAIVNAGDGKREHPTQALLDVYTLRSRLGKLDGASIWIVGDVALARRALEHHRLPAHGRQGHRRRAAHADPARDRGARLRRALHARRAALGRRRLRAAHAARAHERDVGALAARVRLLVSGQRPAPVAAPGADAPRAGQSRRGALRRGRRLAPGRHHRAGRGRRRRAHGRPLRAARRRQRPRPRPRPGGPRPPARRSASASPRDGRQAARPRPAAAGRHAPARRPRARSARGHRRPPRRARARRRDRRDRPARHARPRARRGAARGPGAPSAARPSSTRTCTCARPARSTRRTSTAARAPPPPAATPRCSRCPTPTPCWTPRRCFAHCATQPRAKRAYQSVFCPRSHAACRASS